MTGTSLRDKAEAFLAADDRVASFALTDIGDGLQAVVTGADTWYRRERAAARGGTRGRILRQWQMVYDRSYRWDRTVRAPNFDAWVSGFTGDLIPPARMQIWLDDALAQLRSVPHARVLDIGCGVGLVLAALAPGGETYDGIDFSEEAIGSLGAWVATQPALRHVRLTQCAAHEIDDLDTVEAELAIMNSVVQYFPDTDYLSLVLAAAAKRIAPAGSIFLGDLRAAALLPMRAACVAVARAPADSTAGQARADAEAALGLARELAIDPGFFQGLASALPRLGRARFSLKPTAADHELSGYRYDAMLMLDVPEADPAPVVAAGALDEIVAHLDRERPGAAAVLGIANARLARDVALADALRTAAADTPLAGLVERVAAAAPSGVEPAALAEAAAKLGYAAEMRFTPGSPEGRFDVLLTRDGVRARWPDLAVTSHVANDPLGAELASKLHRELQGALNSVLGGSGLARVEVSPPA